MWMIKESKDEEPDYSFHSDGHKRIKYKYVKTTDVSRAYNADVRIPIQTHEDPADVIRRFEDVDLDPHFSKVIPAVHNCEMAILSKPFFNPQSVEHLIKEANSNPDGLLFIRNSNIPYDLASQEDVHVTTPVQGYWGSKICKIYTSKSKVNSHKNRSKYAQTTKYRYGRVPVSWFGSFAYVMLSQLDLRVNWSHGWGNWDCIGYMWPNTWPRVKKLFIHELRENERFVNLINKASHYVNGAIEHQTNNFRLEWAKQMKHECEILNIHIPNYKKGAKDA